MEKEIKRTAHEVSFSEIPGEIIHHTPDGDFVFASLYARALGKDLSCLFGPGGVKLNPFTRLYIHDLIFIGN